jgi:hypothetical protein
MAKRRIHYQSSERGQAKAFLERSDAVRISLGSERHARWLTLGGTAWIEYDDPPFYTLFLESSLNTRDM